ncbi:MAG TPA: DUF4142 domain-containing protein [Blastocatellia bacterium]|nr:DUF4142 domain-containing protein [Blastocatellia bacterium]
MNRTSLKAVVFVSLLTMLILGINLVVGAQQPTQPQQPSPAQPQTDKPMPAETMQTAGALNASEKKFITDTAHNGMNEVEMAKLAVTKAASDEVKQYAQRLVDDHTKANDALMALASQKGVTISHDMAAAPADTTMKQTSSADPAMKTKDAAAMNKDHAALMSKLNGLSGNEFDKEFIRAAVKSHEKGVKSFEKQSTSATDADVKAFATNTLPTLREHLQMARDLDKKLSATK